MSLKAIHCFGSGQLPIGTSAGGTVVDAGLDSGYACAVDSNNETLVLAPSFIAASLGDMVIAGARAKLSLTTQPAVLLYIRRSGDGTDYCFIRQEATGEFSIRVNTVVNSTGTLIGSTFTPTWDPLQYNYYELGWIPDDAAGTILFRVNGVAPAGWTDVLPAATVDTKAGTSTTSLEYTVGAYRFSNGASISLGDMVLYDDVDNGDGWVPTGQTLIGPVRIPWLPAASSAESDWLGSDADSIDNHLLLDEVPSDTVDYISSATPTDRQVLGNSGTIPVAGTVLAVQAEIYGRDDNAGSQTVNAGVRSNVSETVSTLVLSPSDGLYQVPVPLDPNGGGAWGTEAGPVTSAQVVVEVV